VIEFVVGTCDFVCNRAITHIDYQGGVNR